MDRNISNSESPLLLKMPKSMLSFSDMSGNSFLMPVAANDVVASQQPMQPESKPEKQDDNTKVPELPSVCQLQQPLLMRRSSSPALQTAVPYSESNVPIEGIDVGLTLNARLPLVSGAPTCNQNDESMNWPSSVPLSVGQSIEPTPIFTGCQNLQNLQPDSVNQPSYSQSMAVNQENNLRQQHIFQPPQTTFSGSSNFASSSTPILNIAPSSFPEKSDYCAASSHEYYSQPPIITPSAVPVYYNNSGKNTSQIPSATYSSVSPSQSYSMHHSSSLPNEMYSRVYEPVKPYWLFQNIVETKEIWCAFSAVDSEKLEIAFQQDPQAIVPVEGGRYDVILAGRIKKPVYFDANSLQIRRCTWFYCSESSQKFTPFLEETSNILEQHYSTCVTSGQWQKRVNIPKVGTIVFENPQLMLFYDYEFEMWSTLPDSKVNPKAVRRGLPEGFGIPESENSQIDHLVFIVQGIGSFCDLRFRTVTECVDGFRDIANKMLLSHFKQEVENGQIGRVEFLPLAWHAKLHTSDKGFDRCMRNITLPSIPKLRHFTNDTLLDILLYSSPIYCQSIIDTVASELNKLYAIFVKRNPNFTGKVFVAGHSLGSLILFDILSHQKKSKKRTVIPDNKLNSDMMPTLVGEDINVPPEHKIIDEVDSIASLLQSCELEKYAEIFEKEKIGLSTLIFLSDDDLKDLGLPMGPRKKLLNALHPEQIKSSSQNCDSTSELMTGVTLQDIKKEEQQNIHYSESFIFPFKTSPCMQSIFYPRLQFEPACFFALGSPIAMFLTVRGYESISEDFRLPTCPNFFHIFHPYDPVAFRIECLIDHKFSEKPVLIPHHKGRKRMHLEIRENLAKRASKLKQKIIESLKYTWQTLSSYARPPFPSAEDEALIDKLVYEQMAKSEYEQLVSSETSGEEIPIGCLNGGRRIDYVLQEKPIEALNDYIFALSSHATYWDSEDTVLMILREIYETDGIVISSQSTVENKPLIHEQSSCNAHSSHFNAYPFQSPRTEPMPSISPFYNQNMPTSVPGSYQSMQMSNSYSAPVFQVTSNMPPPPSTSFLPQSEGPLTLSSSTTMQQPIGPPPLSSSTTTQQPFDPLPLSSSTTTQQPFGPLPLSSSTTTQQPFGPPPLSSSTTTQQPVDPPPMSSSTTTQPLGPPPLTGFIKKSPFRQ